MMMRTADRAATQWWQEVVKLTDKENLNFAQFRTISSCYININLYL